jgi:hypothetical protein
MQAAQDRSDYPQILSADPSRQYHDQSQTSNRHIISAQKHSFNRIEMTDETRHVKGSFADRRYKTSSHTNVSAFYHGRGGVGMSSDMLRSPTDFLSEEMQKNRRSIINQEQSAYQETNLPAQHVSNMKINKESNVVSSDTDYNRGQHNLDMESQF